jgi:hypothetical protein
MRGPEALSSARPSSRPASSDRARLQRLRAASLHGVTRAGEAPRDGGRRPDRLIIGARGRRRDGTDALPSGRCSASPPASEPSRVSRAAAGPHGLTSGRVNGCPLARSAAGLVAGGGEERVPGRGARRREGDGEPSLTRGVWSSPPGPGNPSTHGETRLPAAERLRPRGPPPGRLRPFGPPTPGGRGADRAASRSRRSSRACAYPVRGRSLFPTRRPMDAGARAAAWAGGTPPGRKTVRAGPKGRPS